MHPATYFQATEYLSTCINVNSNAHQDAKQGKSHLHIKSTKGQL